MFGETVYPERLYCCGCRSFAFVSFKSRTRFHAWSWNHEHPSRSNNGYSGDRPIPGLTIPVLTEHGNHILRGPGDWRNEFDVCADASFIYIIWETIPASVEQLWVTVVPIGSGTPLMTVRYRAVLIMSVIGKSLPLPAIRATTAAKARGTTPAFDLSFISNYIDQTTEKIMVASLERELDALTTTPTADFSSRRTTGIPQTDHLSFPEPVSIDPPYTNPNWKHGSFGAALTAGTSNIRWRCMRRSAMELQR